MFFCSWFLNSLVRYYRAFAHHQPTLLGFVEGREAHCVGELHVISINGHVDRRSLVITVVW